MPKDWPLVLGGANGNTFAQCLAVNLKQDILAIGGDLYEVDFGWDSAKTDGISFVAAYYIERPSLRWLITLTNLYAVPVSALAISNDGKRIIAATHRLLDKPQIPVIIFIDSVLGNVLSIKKYFD